MTNSRLEHGDTTSRLASMVHVTKIRTIPTVTTSPQHTGYRHLDTDHDESASEVVSVHCDGRESTIRLSSASSKAKDSQSLKSIYPCPRLERKARSITHSPTLRPYVHSINSTTIPSDTRHDTDPPTRNARCRESPNGLSLSKRVHLEDRLLPQWHVLDEAPRYHANRRTQAEPSILP